MSKTRLEITIIEACDKLIKEFANIVRDGLSLYELPMQIIPYTLMEPSGPLPLLLVL